MSWGVDLSKDELERIQAQQRTLESTPYETITKEELMSDFINDSDHAHTSTASIREKQGKGEEVKTMATIKEVAQQYTPQHTKNIAELPEVNIEEMQLEDRSGVDGKGDSFDYKVTIVNGEEYRVPGSVIGSIKGILEKKPTLKRISVSKTGDGLNTRYTVIPLE